MSRFRPNAKSPATLAAVAAALLLAAAAPAAAQYDPYAYDCTESRKNMQCNEFGVIKMDSEKKISGEPVEITAEITLNTNYEQAGARWVMFSVRNVTEESGEPISVELLDFSTPNGPMVVTETKDKGSNEANLWVHVMDVPVGQPITMKILVGASERGAFKLEVLVMAFDRGYATVKDAMGVDASLFSFTLLSVQQETTTVGGGDGGSGFGRKLPAPAVPAFALGLLALAFVARRRSA